MQTESANSAGFSRFDLLYLHGCDKLDTMIGDVYFGQCLSIQIKHAANEKGLVTCNTNIDSNNLVPNFVGVDARMHIHRTGSGLRLDPAAQSGMQRPRGGGPAASHSQGAGGRAEERWPGAFAVCDRLVNFVRSQRVSVVTLSSTSGRNVSAVWAARGQTPLHVATAEGHVEVVKLLVERWRRWRCKTSLAGASAAEYLDLWPWRFVVGFTASLGGCLHSRCR